MSEQCLIENEVSLKEWNHPFEYYLGSGFSLKVNSNPVIEVEREKKVEDTGPNYFLIGGPYPNYCKA